ncbi:MAG: hypothetical protein AW12_03000 [Candidatus Accumulibacter sp. BA-94]|nr:MAG: hypothetical protein AW12_03000 [Candidatus Accumulibacter sp. BA-94]
MRVDANRLAQGQRGERVGRVVGADQLDLTERNQPLGSAQQPAVGDPVVVCPRRRLETKADYPTVPARGSQAAAVVAIDDHYAVPLEDPRLGRSVLVEAPIAVEMVFADIEHRCRIGSQRTGRFELETRQLQYPDRWQLTSVDGCHQGVERGRADVASNHRTPARRPAQGTGKRSGGGLAVAAGNGDHQRLRGRPVDGPGEQLDLGNQRNAARTRLLNQRLVHPYARRNGHQVDPGEGFRSERAGKDHCFGDRGTQRIGLRRGATAVGNAHARALTGQPPGHRQAAFAKADDEDQLSAQFHLSATSGWTSRSAPA